MLFAEKFGIKYHTVTISLESDRSKAFSKCINDIIQDNKSDYYFVIVNSGNDDVHAYPVFINKKDKYILFFNVFNIWDLQIKQDKYEVFILRDIQRSRMGCKVSIPYIVHTLKNLTGLKDLFASKDRYTMQLHQGDNGNWYDSLHLGKLTQNFAGCIERLGVLKGMILDVMQQYDKRSANDLVEYLNEILRKDDLSDEKSKEIKDILHQISIYHDHTSAPKEKHRAKLANNKVRFTELMEIDGVFEMLPKSCTQYAVSLHTPMYNRFVKNELIRARESIHKQTDISK